MTEIRDATPPPGEWTDFFLAQIAERDGVIDRLANKLSRQDVILEWIKNNKPSTLQLCPWKNGEL